MRSIKKLLPFIIAIACLQSFQVKAEALKCDNLPVMECWSTSGCVLACDSTANVKKCEPYHCRAAKDPCEAMVAQKDIDPQKCQSSMGCSYEAPNCFCPGPMECYCGGGPPARCHKK